jgi:hypothetical protein
LRVDGLLRNRQHTLVVYDDTGGVTARLAVITADDRVQRPLVGNLGEGTGPSRPEREGHRRCRFLPVSGPRIASPQCRRRRRDPERGWLGGRCPLVRFVGRSWIDNSPAIRGA